MPARAGTQSTRSRRAYRLFSDYRSNRSLGLNREYVTQLATLAEEQRMERVTVEERA